MSIDEQKKVIDQLLQDLDDESQSLKKTHTHVLISFDQMLGYIDRIIKPELPNDGVRKRVMQKDIEFLLQTYKEMAQRYYTQFELTLLQEIQTRRKAASLSEKAIQLIDLKDPGDQEGIDAMKRTRQILSDDCRASADALQDLKEDFPTLLQDALDKLRDEWQRLGTLAVASETLAKDKKLIKSLEAVVEVAAASVGIEAERIVVVPGREFALYFFSYLENFIVFTVPIYSVQAPWEWSIFWHELAGHRVRSLERGTAAIDEIRTKIQDFHRAYIPLGDEDRSRLLDDVMQGNQACIKYLKDILSGKEPLDPIDLGGFDYQFERMMLKLPPNSRIKMYESMKKEGWCVDWFKELFEDAWSILTIRQPFLIFLQDILIRKSTVDSRHPLTKIRLGVANELLRRAYPNGDDNLHRDVALPQPELTDEEKLIVDAAAKQLLTFLALIMAASSGFGSSTHSNGQDLARQENKLFEDLPKTKIHTIFKNVTNIVQEAILDWSTNLHTAADPAKEAQRCAKKYISAFSSSEFFKWMEKKKSPEPSYEKLLKRENQTDKSYEELLALSFYDTDFGVSSVANVYHFITKKFDTARLQSVPLDVTMGAVTYESGGVQKKTSRELWNAAAVSGFQIP